MTFIKPTDIKLKGGIMTPEAIQKLIDEGATFAEIHEKHGVTACCSICEQEFQDQMLKKMGYKTK